MPNGVSAYALALALAVAGGCAVGPDFTAPDAPKIERYTAEPLAEKTASTAIAGGAAQRFLAGEDVSGQWWTLYKSAALNRLIADAIKASPTLETAKATLRQAEENTAAETGALFPQIAGSASATRQKGLFAGFGPNGTTTLYSLASASLNVSYGLDIFGGARRAIEAAGAQEEFERDQLHAAWVTLTANIVATAVLEASLRAQEAATRDIIDIETNALTVLDRQLELGGIAGGAVLAQKAVLAQAKSALPPLQKALAQARNRLAMLAGRYPNEDVAGDFDLSQLSLPEELPLSLPAKLVAQRPDVRAAEAQLHAASAEIGVATANMLPEISLTGSYGNSGTPAGALLNPGVGVFSAAGSLTQTLFDGGTLLHQRRAAVAAYDVAAAQYRQTVLAAFQDVANAIRALQADADALAADAAAADAADRSLDLTRQQYADGAVSYTALLNAEQTAQQARISLVQSQAARISDSAALFQALGGGWWNADKTTLDPDRPDASAGQSP